LATGCAVPCSTRARSGGAEIVARKQVGRLYLFQHNLCFESDVFGAAQADRFPLDQVHALMLDKKALKFVFNEKRLSYINLRETEKFGAALFPLWEGLRQEQPLQQGEKEKRSKKGEKGKAMRARGQESAAGTPRGAGSVDPSAAITMTTEDWSLLLEGAKLVGFADGVPVITEGMAHHRIYQVASGKCTIKKRTDAGEITLGTMDEGALFGEMTFLEKGNATASVIAQGDVQIYIIEGYFINILFVDYPDLAGRFYSYLATVLAQRLSDREMAIQKELQKATDERRRRRREAKAHVAQTDKPK